MDCSMLAVNIWRSTSLDITSITAAYSGLKAAKDIFSSFTELKIEADTVARVNEAVKKVSDAQEALFELREELFRLQDENNNLRKQISEQTEWNSRLENYELIKTAGGAVVYKSKQGTEHYICPTCREKREIHILQNNRTVSGKYRCVNCKAEFPINPHESVQRPQVISTRPI